MTTPHKSTREPHEETELIDRLIPVYEKNVERLAELELPLPGHWPGTVDSTPASENFEK